MNTKHELAELHVGGKEKCTIYDKFGQRVGNTFEGVLATQRSDEQCQQAARLFSAAPELLEALQAICDEQDERQGYASYETYDKARAAIYKATGASQ